MGCFTGEALFYQPYLTPEYERCKEALFHALEEYVFVVTVDLEEEMDEDVMTLYNGWDRIVQKMEDERCHDDVNNLPLDAEVAGYRRNVFADLPDEYKSAKKVLVAMANVYAARAEQCHVQLPELFLNLLRLSSFMVLEELICLAGRA